MAVIESIPVSRNSDGTNVENVAGFVDEIQIREFIVTSRNRNQRGEISAESMACRTFIKNAVRPNGSRKNQSRDRRYSKRHVGIRARSIEHSSHPDFPSIGDE